eukprot:3156135-Rhodomonas_salina.2
MMLPTDRGYAATSSMPLQSGPSTSPPGSTRAQASGTVLTFLMPGTDLAYAAISYAVSGTGTLDGAITLRACHAMSGTEIVYAEAKCHDGDEENSTWVSTLYGPTHMLREVRY